LPELEMGIVKNPGRLNVFFKFWIDFVIINVFSGVLLPEIQG
jgi:hypothetical protein